MEVEIEKLPLIGSPYSFKTRKQGRRKAIEKLLKSGANNGQRIYVARELAEYSGDNKFLLSIRDQITKKGVNGLTLKQIMTAEQVLKRLSQADLKSANQLGEIYRNIINQ